MADLELRRWSVADAARLRVVVAGSPDLARQLGGSDLRDLDACAAFVETHLTAADAGGHHLAISVGGSVVGDVGISAVDPVHQTAWVSYWLDAEHRGRGLATRAVASAAAWATAELGVFRLELGHRVNNPASCRVATRAGFVAEGVERAKLRYGAERFDVETHARLATDPGPDVALVPVRYRPGARAPSADTCRTA